MPNCPALGRSGIRMKRSAGAGTSPVPVLDRMMNAEVPMPSYDLTEKKGMKNLLWFMYVKYVTFTHGT
jgi:hypothetical protein